MEAGTIKRIFEFYMSPEFKDEILRALKEFFGKALPLDKDGRIDFRSDDEAGLFNEWFVFDFKLRNGKTPLEDFYERNPYHLEGDRLQIYKDLQENRYSYFRVMKNILGTGLILKDILTGVIYELKEYSLTFEVREGQSFPARVAKVGDHYEIVSGSIVALPIRLSPELELSLKESKIVWSPKKIWEDYIKDRKAEFSLDEYPTLSEAESNLNETLKDYGLDKYVNTSLIKEWIYNQIGDINQQMSIILSLLSPACTDYSEAIGVIMEKYNKFYNLCPQRALGGKSPFDKMKEQQEKGIIPDFEVKVSRVAFPELHIKYHEFIKYLEAGRDYRTGLKKINKIFKFMLEKMITHPEIYRLYANKGVCHLALGDFEKGVFFLTVAIEFNPYYQFAQVQLKKVKELGFEPEIIEFGKVSRDIGYLYYEFIKVFKINFAHKVDEVVI